jgi:hypothetical protein
MVNDDADEDLAGGSAIYHIASLQYKFGTTLPLKLGVDYLWSEDVNDNAGVNTGLEGKEDEGYVLNASTKTGDWSFQVKHYDIGLNSVPLQGAVSQDNFRFSSNFEGQRYQIGYNFGGGVKMDVRLYDQNQKSTGVGGTVQGHVMNVEDNTRYQVNLNAKF